MKLSQTAAMRLSDHSILITSPKRNCQITDDRAVVLLSNFSIKHNFSHFLHAMLRLFCALVDARYITWSSAHKKFDTSVNFTLWLDEYLPMSDAHMGMALSAHVLSVSCSVVNLHMICLH